MSVFLERNHMVLRNPDGSDGNIAAMSKAGFGAVYCNIRDFPPERWQTIRDRARAAGVECGPWARTAQGGSGGWDEAMLQRLVSVADEWNSSLIVDSEKELDGTGDTLTRHIVQVLADRDYGLSTEAWPFASVDWTPFADTPVLPQIFPAESEPSKDPAGCREAWRKAGIRCVVFTFGAYQGMTPSMFDRLTPYGVYCADDMSGQYQPWAPLGTHDPCAAPPKPPKPQPQPPSPEEPVMPPVTSNQARSSVVFDAQAWENTQTSPSPKARLTLCRRICQDAMTDDKWNTIRDQVQKLIDSTNVPA